MVDIIILTGHAAAKGFEVTVAGRSYFAFSDFTQDGKKVVSYCQRTKDGRGWSHDITVRNWACFYGKKEGQSRPKYHELGEMMAGQQGLYSQSMEDAEDINSKQSSWQATVYPHLNLKKMKDIIRMRGGEKSVLHSTPRQTGPVTHRLLRRNKTERNIKNYLPLSWDWRDVQGVSYVSDVRDQGGCGSCYAFSSLGMLEARVKILTNNTVNPVFSTQDIVSCSPLSQGCEGGFPYLVAGRFAKDYGVVAEDCNPYVGKDGACSTKTCLK